MSESDEDKIESGMQPTSTSHARHRRELRLTAPSLLQQRYYVIRDDNNSVQLLVACDSKCYSLVILPYEPSCEHRLNDQ